MGAMDMGNRVVGAGDAGIVMRGVDDMLNLEGILILNGLMEIEVVEEGVDI